MSGTTPLRLLVYRYELMPYVLRVSVPERIQLRTSRGALHTASAPPDLEYGAQQSRNLPGKSGLVLPTMYAHRVAHSARESIETQVERAWAVGNIASVMFPPRRCLQGSPRTARSGYR